MEDIFTAKHLTTRWTQDRPEYVHDLLAIEEPLEMRVVYGPVNERLTKSISVTMRTPGNDRHLALGFMFTEGILTTMGQVAQVEQAFWSPNVVTVQLKPEAQPSMPDQDKNFYTSSSCGVCGKASIEAIKTVSIYQNVPDNVSISTQSLYSLKNKFQDQQKIFDATGGIHASGLFNQQGQLNAVGEDVGRHNALDKVIGKAFEENLLPLTSQTLFLSGRASFELIQKANMAGIRIIVALGAPSSLAVETAQAFGITLVGFLKNDRFNLYTGPERIVV